jgi:hypothetical protein
VRSGVFPVKCFHRENSSVFYAASGSGGQESDVTATPHPRELKAFGGKQPAKMFHVKNLRRPFAEKEFTRFG